MPKKKVGHTISAVARSYQIHPQTLRLYEREGLLKPSRTRGNTRLYTDQDLERLEVILTLTRELRVNLAGVDVILNMREKMERMRLEAEHLISFLQTQFDLDTEALRSRMKEWLVPVPPSKLMRVEVQKAKERPDPTTEKMEV